MVDATNTGAEFARQLAEATVPEIRCETGKCKNARHCRLPDTCTLTRALRLLTDQRRIAGGLDYE